MPVAAQLITASAVIAAPIGACAETVDLPCNFSVLHHIDGQPGYDNSDLRDAHAYLSFRS